MLALASLTTLLLGATVPQVHSSADVLQHMGLRVEVFGVLERVELGKGKAAWEGTGLVLDDDTVIYVTYGAPPDGWATHVGARVRVEGELRPSLGDREQSLLAPHLRSGAAPKPAPRALKDVLGKRVRLVGTARDAKGGAVLLVENQPLYLAGLDAWPDAAHGRQVVVGGTVTRRQYLPEATKNSRGEWSQGAAGAQLVIDAPTWRLFAPPEAPDAGVRGGKTK